MRRPQRIAVARYRAAQVRPGKYVLSDAFLDAWAAVGLDAALRNAVTEWEVVAARAVRNPYLPPGCGGPDDGIAR